MIVVDNSVVVGALAETGALGRQCAEVLGRERLVAPELLDIEAVSALRGLVLGGRISPAAGGAALAGLARLAIDRLPHRPLLPRIWEMRDNLTVYDAAYVALAERLDVSLFTCDAGIAGAPGPRCPVVLLG